MGLPGKHILRIPWYILFSRMVREVQLIIWPNYYIIPKAELGDFGALPSNFG